MMKSRDKKNIEKTPKRLPDLIIIGAQKAGTTSLHYYLSHHSEIWMSKRKELNFFIQEEAWDQGTSWYMSNFTGSEIVAGETSPNYTFFPFFKGVPKRMYSVVPEVKLIYILRDPIERVISNYIHDYAKGDEHRTFSEAMKSPFESNHYLCRSRYYFQLEQYLEYFQKSNMLIVALEDLHSSPRTTMQKIFRFLQVDASFSSPTFSEIRYRSSEQRRKNRFGYLLIQQLDKLTFLNRLSPAVQWYIKWTLSLPFSTKIQRPSPDKNLRQAMTEFLKKDIDQLRQYTGLEFQAWSV